MTDSHLSHDQLVETLYGLGSTRLQSHLAQCPECRQQHLKLDGQRRQQIGIRPATEGQLYGQRQAVLSRLGSGYGWNWRKSTLGVGALAAGLVIGAVFTSSSRPLVPKTREVAVSAEETDFSDLLNVELTAEARAATPLRGLFETGAEDK